MELILGTGTVVEASRDTMPATGTPGWATDGDPASSIPATDFPASHYNMTVAEIVQVILDAGLTLDRTDWGQLSAAVKKLASTALSDGGVLQLVNDVTTGIQSLGFNTQQKIVAATDTAGTVYFLPQTYTDTQTEYIQRLGYVANDGNGAPYVSVECASGNYLVALRPWVSTQVAAEASARADADATLQAWASSTFVAGLANDATTAMKSMGFNTQQNIVACTDSAGVVRFLPQTYTDAQTEYVQRIGYVADDGNGAPYLSVETASGNYLVAMRPWVTAQVAAVQTNLTTAISNQSNTNSTLQNNIDGKLSLSGGTLKGDLYVGTWIHCNTLTAFGQDYINILNSVTIDYNLTVAGSITSGLITSSGDVHAGPGKYGYFDYLTAETSGDPITFLSALVSKEALSISLAGTQFSGDQTDSGNPIGGKADGTYFDGRTIFHYSDGTTPMYLGTGAARSLLNFYNGSSLVGNIQNNGGSVSYNTTSDYRLKTDIAALDGSAAARAILALRPVSHRWKADADGEATHGFIAHELQQEAPYAVHGQKDAVDENGQIVPQTVDYARLVPDLTAALQNALNRIAQLESHLASRPA